MTGQRGRPISKERQMARIMGDKTYKGKRCKECGGVDRYTKGSSCVACTKHSSDLIRTRTARNARRRAASHAAEDLSDLMGETLVPDQAIDSTAETDAWTPTAHRLTEGYVGDQVPEVAGEPGDWTPSALISDSTEGKYTGINDKHTDKQHRYKGNSRADGVQQADSSAEPMASSETGHWTGTGREEKNKTRYWCHPESGCVWTTPGTDSTSDGLVEEISEDAFADLVKAGFTITTATDDLDDILG
jgi:hypothetical protein